MKKVDSNASNYQPSPKTTHRLLSLSSEDLKTHSRSSSHDAEISFRFRQERLIRNENIEKNVNEIKTKLYQQSSSVLSTNNETSLFHFLTIKYRRPLFIGVFTLFTGSLLLLYKYTSSNNRNH